MRGDNHAANLFRDLLDMRNGALGGNALKHLFAVETKRAQLFHQERVHLYHLCAVHDVADIDIAEYGFHAGGAARDD
ncbi:hypothetical protein SDC9_156851 [bioreactor metagenome]|uniref:Uncharacterized protein n=1 Tax=bioreactor metagenome TaxID=1076179 RepID=A0A645F6Q2_9ZZZZ